MRQRVLGSASFVVPGIVAGLAGGVSIDAFLIAVTVFVRHATTVGGFYAFVASGAIGEKAAATNPFSLWIGLGVHFAISALWGAGYAYVAGRTPQVAARPFTSGLVFGFLIYFVMQLIEVPAGIYRLPTPSTLLIAIFAHCIFFGVPIAYALRALTERRA